MRLFPKKRDFFKMLLNQAEKTEEGLKAFTEFMAEPSEARAERVRVLEKEADELRRILIDELNQAFVTPIDREDIFALSRVVDDMVDYAKSTVEEVLIFQVTTNSHMKAMVQDLYGASSDISAAIRMMKDRPRVCSDYLIRVKKMENGIERKYRDALADLFKSRDAIEIIKMREIYRHLSNAADRGDEAADIIGDILVKTT